ncbi:MAG: monovalent cation/H+ antiporter complex subunit F [Actinomycetes bacterium]
MSAVEVLLALTAAVLEASALLALYRLAKGPTGLDRAVASDVLIAILIAAIGAHAVWQRTSAFLVILLVLSLVGFTTAVGLARLITGTSVRERRFLEAEARATRERDPENARDEEAR